MKNLILIGLLLAIAACNVEKKPALNDAAIIEGEIKNIPSGSMVFLRKIDGPVPIPIDSVLPDAKGNFVLEIPADDEHLYILTISDQRLPLFVEKGKHILKADYNQLYNSAQYSGSPLTDAMKRVDNIRVDFDERSKELTMAYQTFAIKRDKIRADSVEKLYNQALAASKTKVKKFIDSLGPGPVSHLATSMLNPDEDFGYLDSLATRFEKEKPQKAYTRKMLTFMEKPRKLGQGREAPDFSQADPNGTQIKLSSFRGKWILLDFWASWCKPCRYENPTLVSAYHRFKNKNFNIVSVSLDSEKENWLKASIADRMVWTHLSDLKGWDNEAAKLYGVNSIPASFLLDPNGKIVAKNLRGEALVAKLQEVLK